MKKIVIIIVAFLLISFTGFYLFTNINSTISDTTFNYASESNVSKFLLYEDNWLKWWPGEKDLNNKSFTYKGKRYKFIKKTNSGLFLEISENNSIYNASILFFPMENLKTRLTFIAAPQKNFSFINPFSQFNSQKILRNEVNEILQAFNNFINNQKLVYGYEIQLSKVKDSVMLVSSTTIDKYPTTLIVEKMIQNIRQQIKNQNGTETNYPMLNVTQIDKEKYQVMVAIPTNKSLKQGNNTVLQKMVLGNILEAKIIGGPNTIMDAFSQIQLFMKDHQLTSPAMPFESMVTNRASEPDSSKWVTKIFYPIF